MCRLPRLLASLCLFASLAACAGGADVVRAESAAAPEVVPETVAAGVEPIAVADGAAAAEPVPADAAPTQAELDFAAIYGDRTLQQGAYDPVADPTLPAPAELPESYDPWEPLNRRVTVDIYLQAETRAMSASHS